MAKQPRSIVAFEWAYWLAMIIGTVGIVLRWDQTAAQVDAATGDAGRGNIYMIWYFAFWGPFFLLTWYFAAYRRSVGARWLVVAVAILNLFDLGGMAITDQLGQDLEHVLVYLFFIPSLLAVWLLFRSDAKRWFDERRDLPEVFR